MIAQIVISAKAILESHQREKQAFKNLCNSLPPDVVSDLRSKRKKQTDQLLQHYRDLEIAREGRSLNFWGNR